MAEQPWIKPLFQGFIVLSLIVSTGCMIHSKEKTAFNASLRDPAFVDTFADKTIVMVAPASSRAQENIAQLEALPQVNIVVPENSFDHVIPFHSNTDEKRFALLKAALLDPNQKTVIWTLRGGYGSARLIEKLNKLPKPKTHKWFIGSSDITALHIFLSQKWQWKTIHGEGLVTLLDNEADPENFRKIAAIIDRKSTAKAPILGLDDLSPMNALAKKAKKISGRLTGGNLTMVQTSIGTAWQIKTSGKIVFLEEVGEKGYRVDRTLQHLKQAGLLKNVKAVVFGQFLTGDEHVIDALERFAKETKIPIFKSNEFGHGIKNYPLVYNAKAEIVAEKSKKNQEKSESAFALWMY